MLFVVIGPDSEFAAGISGGHVSSRRTELGTCDGSHMTPIHKGLLGGRQVESAHYHEPPASVQQQGFVAIQAPCLAIQHTRIAANRGW
eukprot:scaffold2454_cov58-Attheya_sp.AAC.3